MKSKSIDLTTGSPGKGLLLFALPLILGNLFQQFYNMVDTIIVGKYVGQDALAAVGASYALTTVFVMIAIGGGTGASVIISQFLGAKENSKMKTAISTAMTAFLVTSIALGALGIVANRQILSALRTPDNIMSDATLYLKIYFIGLPFLFMYNILASIFNALGDSKTSLYFLIFSSLLNIVLDLYAVRILHMGVAGVAIATVIAQGIAAILSFFVLLKKLKAYDGTGKFFDGIILKKMVIVAIPWNVVSSVSGKWFRLCGTCRIYRRNASGIHLHRAYDFHGKCSIHLHCTKYGSRTDRKSQKRISDKP